MHILIVEDDTSTGKLLGKFLLEVGECQYASNAKEAMKKYRQLIKEGRPFDLVCLDIMLPDGVSGIEILKQIRAIEHDNGVLIGEGSKILMISSMGDEATVVEAFRGLCDGFIAKPFNKKNIYNKLKEIELLDNEMEI